MMDLFATASETLGDGALLLRGFAGQEQAALEAGIAIVAAASPFRHFTTPGGRTMSVAMTSCGDLGWVSDHRGYRYEALDPDTLQPWPAMPAAFLSLGRRAALAARFSGFAPDCCLINRYQPGTALSLHQDRDEEDLSAPIVSVSLGLPAMFLWGGDARGDRVRRIPLEDGDVVVWGGRSRLRFHGVARLARGHDPAIAAVRHNLTFRRTGQTP